MPVVLTVIAVGGWPFSTVWDAGPKLVMTGVLLTVTSTDPHQAARIRGLGFTGIMAEGSHHQAHHLAMARGEPVH